MSAETPEPRPMPGWSWLRWTTAIAIVFAVHVALIFVFGARKPVPTVRVQRTTSLSLVDESPGDWLALNDATLFALPGNNGFAASMWTELPPLDIHFRQDWTEAPHWLTISNPVQMAGLFAPFRSFIKTNHFAAVHFEFNLPAEVVAPSAPTEPPIAQQSTLQIEGGLAGRHLPGAGTVQLPSWPDADVDAPSVVQVVVNAAGDVVSAVLLPQEIMSQGTSWEPPLVDKKEADRWAIEFARSLHFTPLPSNGAAPANPLAGLVIGQLIFNWHTVPQSPTDVTNL